MSALISNCGRTGSQLAADVAQPWRPGPLRRYSASDRLRPTYRQCGESSSLVAMASVTPTDEKESWISSVPPSTTLAPHRTMSSLAGL